MSYEEVEGTQINSKVVFSEVIEAFRYLRNESYVNWPQTHILRLNNDETLTDYDKIMPNWRDDIQKLKIPNPEAEIHRSILEELRKENEQ